MLGCLLKRLAKPCHYLRSRALYSTVINATVGSTETIPTKSAVQLKASAFTGKPEFYETLYFLDDIFLKIQQNCQQTPLNPEKVFQFHWLGKERLEHKLGFELSLLQYQQIRERLEKIVPFVGESDNLMELISVFATNYTVKWNQLNEDDIEADNGTLHYDRKNPVNLGKIDEKGRAVSIGRRKSSSAKVYLVPGSGEFFVNGKRLVDYFPRFRDLYNIAQPFKITESFGKYNVWGLVEGGGLTGQAGAITAAVAKAIALRTPNTFETLDNAGLLTRDARQVERKKPGQEKARKKFTWVKR